MAIVKMKSTSAGRRGMARVVTEDLHKGASCVPLLKRKSSTVGRNSNGHIITCHKDDGHKHHYCAVDFKRNKDDIPTGVERIEYGPNRTAFTALLCYASDERRYTIAPRGIQVGAILASDAETAIKVGDTPLIRNIPVGMTIHCIGIKPGRDTQITRSAGASVVSLVREGAYARACLCSSEVRKINVDCRVTIGEVGSEERNLKEVGKVGVNRRCGIRPTVRGTVMNSVDRPHGGGEGRIGGARELISPWDTLAKGCCTRNNKYMDNMIIYRCYSNKG